MIVRRSHAKASIPRRVSADMARDFLAAQPGSLPLVGLGRRGRPVLVDLHADAPHVLVSMGAGSGASVLLRGLAAQHLAAGDRVVILDGPTGPQRIFRGHPSVRYVSDLDAINSELICLAGKAERRRAVPPDPSRLVVILDEGAATLRRLARLGWPGPSTVPDVTPATAAIEALTSQGPDARVHVYLAAPTAPAGLRANFGIRVLGGIPARMWSAVAPELRLPRVSTCRGRVFVVGADRRPRAAQTVLWTAEEAHAWADSFHGFTLRRENVMDEGERNACDD